MQQGTCNKCAAVASFNISWWVRPFTGLLARLRRDYNSWFCVIWRHKHCRKEIRMAGLLKGAVRMNICRVTAGRFLKTVALREIHLSSTVSMPIKVNSIKTKFLFVWPHAREYYVALYTPWFLTIMSIFIAGWRQASQCRPLWRYTCRKSKYCRSHRWQESHHLWCSWCLHSRLLQGIKCFIILVIKLCWLILYIQCLQTHLPGYVEDFDKLKAKGVDEVVWYVLLLHKVTL